MIEIPALEQPMYAPHELDKLQQHSDLIPLEKANGTPAPADSPGLALIPLDSLSGPGLPLHHEHTDANNTQAPSVTPCALGPPNTLLSFPGGAFSGPTHACSAPDVPLQDPSSGPFSTPDAASMSLPMGEFFASSVEPFDVAAASGHVPVPGSVSVSELTLFDQVNASDEAQDVYVEDSGIVAPVGVAGAVSPLLAQIALSTSHLTSLDEFSLKADAFGISPVQNTPSGPLDAVGRTFDTKITTDAAHGARPLVAQVAVVPQLPSAYTEDVSAQSVPPLLILPLPPQLSRQLKASPQSPSPPTKSLRLAAAQETEFSQMRRLMATEMKNPAEYSLHILFTQFVRHAERKLNRFIDHPLDSEPPILELLAEGVDPQFDNMIASLGYIAKREAKPVMDSVMYWRKSKSGVASMAYGEVERVMQIARMTHVAPARDDGCLSPALSTNSGARSKRTLSLVRRRSPQKPPHRDNTSAEVSVSSAPRVLNRLVPSDAARQQLYDDEIAQARATAIQAERKSLASIYILCRVLIEVLRQALAMEPELRNKLEEIVFNQLKTTDPVATSESFVRLANWNLFAELLGHMSEKLFVNVSDRFIADLEKVPECVPYEDEPRLHLLIHGMRCLRLTNYPLERFEEGAQFVQLLTKFFCHSKSHTNVYAYADVLSSLLLLLVPKLTAEANHPLWVEAIAQIYAKAHRLWQALVHSASALALSYLPRNAYGVEENSDWDMLLTLMTSALCVSAKELFASRWFGLIEANAGKFKPKVGASAKVKLLVCISRLVWVYINRLPDTLNNTVKRLDSLFDVLFFGAGVAGKKQLWLVADLRLVNPLCEIIRIVGYQHYNYVLENVLLRLLRASFGGSSLVGAAPEKLVVVVNTYMLCLRDHRLGTRPEFPSDEHYSKILRESESNADAIKKKTRGAAPLLALFVADDAFSKQNKAFSLSRVLDNYAAHEEIRWHFAALLKLVDAQCGVSAWTESEPALATIGVSRSLSSAFNFGLDFGPPAKDAFVDLLVALLDACAWAIAPVLCDSGTQALDFSYQALVEVLVRNCIHEHATVAGAALRALARLASQRNAGNLLTIYSRIAFRISEKPGHSYDDVAYFNSTSFLRLLRVYVELLRCWLHLFLAAGADDKSLVGDDTLDDLYQINFKAPDLTNLDAPAKLKPCEELEWKKIVTVIEAVEGNGLFFLCSGDSRVRLCAVAILEIVEQFDQCIYDRTDKDPADAPTRDTEGTRDEREGEERSPEPFARGHARTLSKYVADEGTRLVQVIDNIDLLDLLKPFITEISGAEKARLSKLDGKRGLVFRLASSDNSIDTSIWFRIYAALLDILFEKCPIAVALCRSIVLARLVQMHELVVTYADSLRSYTLSLFARLVPGMPPELMVTQWKLYLIFACCLLTTTSDQVISLPLQPSQGRKKQLPMYIQYQKITSAKSVFRMVLPLLSAPLSLVREAVVAGLSAVNVNIVRTLTENLPRAISEWPTDAKGCDAADDLERIEVVHILSIVTHRLRLHPTLYADDVTLANLVKIMKDAKNFLEAPAVQVLPEFQRLRCYFCVLLENVCTCVRDTPAGDRWFPFEARIGCFNFLREWCGFGDARAVVDERYAVMTKKAQAAKEPAAMLATLDCGRRAFQAAALSCMATLCAGSLVQPVGTQPIAVLSFGVRLLMRWVHDVLSFDSPRVVEIGRTALRNILAANASNDDIYSETLAQCVAPASSLAVREVYLKHLVDAFVRHRARDRAPPDLFCACLFLIGCDSLDMRSAALACIQHIDAEYYKTGAAQHVAKTVFLKTRVVYKRALTEMARLFAAVRANDAHAFFSYLCKYLLGVDSSTKRDILVCMIPWVQTVELRVAGTAAGAGVVQTALPDRDPDAPAAPDTPEAALDAPSAMVVNNLFEITVRLEADYGAEIHALWAALAGTNADIIFNYIIDQCLRRRNAEFVAHARLVVAHLVLASPDAGAIMDRLVHNLVPKAMVPPSVSTRTEPEPHAFAYLANLAAWSAEAKEAIFSLGQLSMVFLEDLLRASGGPVERHLALLLHVGFSLVDHYLPLVQELAVSLLVHLFQLLVPHVDKTQRIVSALRSKSPHTHLWVYDDFFLGKNGGITPKNMDYTMRTVLELFTPAFPALQKEWSRISLKWGTSCAVRHVACRSFQFFRLLLSYLDQPMLKDMLHRLSNTIADKSADIQGFSMQILMALNAITAELDSEKLIDLPQLFWAGVACLSTVHEHEFIETISMMSKFVSKIDLDSPDTISCLVATFPPKWDGRFDGLQDLVTVGLRSSSAWTVTLRFLDRLTLLQDSAVIGSGDRRLVTVVVANLPRFLHAMDSASVGTDVEKICVLVSSMALARGKPGLSRILDSLAKNRFRSKKDFLKQIALALRDSFFPAHEAHALVLLLNFLSNKIAWVRLETLAALKHVFPAVDFLRDEFRGLGADLIAPFLRLLLTEHAEEALEVMNEAGLISGSQLDKDILRMSMGSASMRREYEQTPTLFGIPDPTGWAVPMPAVAASRTRHNVHAVFATCRSTSAVVDEKAADAVDREQIHFLRDDYRAPARNYTDATSLSVDVPGASLSNVRAALDDFDSFFTRSLETRPQHNSPSGIRVKSQHGHGTSVDTGTSGSGASDNFSPADADSVPQVYDNKALVILNQILARTQSNASFKSGILEPADSPVLAGRSEVPVAKRSYIPFRNSRFARARASAAPGMVSAGAFEQASPVTLSRSSAASGPLSAAPSGSPQDTITPELRGETKRFDLLKRRW